MRRLPIAAPILILIAAYASARAVAAKPKHASSHASSAHTSSQKTHASAKHGSAHKAATHKGSTRKGARPSTKTASHALAPAAMEPARATAIQAALIKQGYLSGEPTGKWDASSTAAMQKLQSDNGWQSKVVPDSRALIKLGLGPDPPK